MVLVVQSKRLRGLRYFTQQSIMPQASNTNFDAHDNFLHAKKDDETIFSKVPCIVIKLRCLRNRGFFFFSVKDRNLFRVDTIGNIFASGAATSENITDGVHEMK